MTEESVSPLRQRMIKDMRIRGMGDKAQKSHIRAIKDFAAFLGRSPDRATPEDLRAYQLHMTDTGREIPDDTCGPIGNLIFVVRISPHFLRRHRMRKDLGIPPAPPSGSRSTASPHPSKAASYDAPRHHHSVHYQWWTLSRTLTPRQSG